MSDRLRMTGLASGMDTQSIVEQLVEVKSYKKTDLINEQTKLGWKQEAWKDLNKKMYSFYTNKLGEMRFEDFFNKKSANIVDSSIAKVSAEGNAVNGTQSLAVKQLAKTQYITSKSYGDDITGKSTVAEAMPDLEIPKTLSVNGRTIEITDTTTMKELAEGFAAAGLNASFDDKTHRLFISAKESGEAGKFEIKQLDGEGNATDASALLKTMGLSEKGGASVIDGQDAKIILNGAEFTSSTNNFSVNGLSITATKESEKTGEDKYVTTNVSVDTDIDGIYDAIKDFFKEYNDLINEMAKLYNADSARDYKVLSDEEKDAMSDEEVEKWEAKIKDSLLRRDDDLGTALEMFKSGMMASFETDGKKFSLASFGMGTLSYLEAAENERYAIHIDGNKDDDTTGSKEDKLRTAITNDLDSVKGFFTKLSGDIYKTMTKQMSRTEYRSIYSMYDDKALQNEYDKLTKDIEKEEEKLSDYEDKWYDKFSKMESAMEKINSKSNSIASLLGMNG
ncbi:MAG: flagellar filament capping protein FliD [Lachnospiraceae bacterium]|nr:flagellar filament capping protein FliD [Lachnospiraceae bacterium]